MRSRFALVTVGVVSTRQYRLGRSRSPVPGERYWLTAGVLGACAALMVLGLTSGPYPRSLRGRFILALLALVPLWALRRWAAPVLMAAAAGTGLVMALGTASLPLGIVLGLAAYLAASSLPRRRSIQAALAAAMIVGAGLLWATITIRAAVAVQVAAGVGAAGRAPAGLEAVIAYAPLVAGWFVGDSVAARRRYLAGLAEQAERERAAEAERASQQVKEERVRIAREMHDVVAHTLAVMTVQAGVGRRLMARRPEEASAALESIETIGRTAQDELRVVLGLLRDEDTAAALAPAPKLTELKELAETVRASGTPVELRMSGTGRPVSPALELSIYRVVQEALTNVVKHAPGAQATVDLEVCDAGIRLEVADDGGSAGRPVTPDAEGGHGIVGMRERIGAFGGWLDAGPRAGRGFRVTAEIPIESAG
jgi:signal transduction histidine kinase